MLTVLVACGSSDGAGDNHRTGDGPEVEANGSPKGDDPAEIAKKLTEKPWEVVSNKGETYLPNVFYAEASENEQIMPYAIDGHVMIDRLIYPTLGNPNLYTKNDVNDELVVVLRIEDAAFAHLGAKVERVANSPLSRLVVPNDPSTGFGFFLVPRSARNPNTESKTAISSGKGTDVVRIYPNDIFINPEPADMPEAFKKRHTLRFVFRQGAMAKAPAGLYDLRFEVKKDDELYRPTASSAPVYEYQYNAVRVFDTEPDEYPVVNITDTQVSVGSEYDAKTKDKLSEVVQFLNTTNDPAIRNAPFISFNGDLHNGGSPASLRQRTVAWTYEQEAKEIVALLKYLPLPIFLTTGNHDGYVATGHVPSAVSALDTGLGESLREVITDASPKAWPDFSMSDFDAYLQKTEASDQLGGIHRDIFTGSFARTPAKDEGFASWKEIGRQDRNFILYDGFYQWQKTYGPLYYSHKFGKSFYLSLNSFELRQHRRSGWGMYTVNYGGGMSDVQVSWLDRELLRASQDGSDVVILAHHDPRGGHKGEDFGYYFEQLEYRSIYQSAINYLVGKVWNPAVCKLPDWALSRDQNESCVHDGLQEWMRPDPEFDCGWDQRAADFTCQSPGTYSSGIELMKRLAANGQVRTVLLGHTHYNALEVLQEGDELLPGQLPIDKGSVQKFATLEIQNPMRGFSELQAPSHATWGKTVRLADYDHHALTIDPMETSFANFVQQYEESVRGWQRTLSNPGGGPRELVVLRLVSNADLANQTYSSGKNALGFSVLFLEKKNDARGVPQAQINRAKFFANVGQSKYDTVGTIDIDRTGRVRPHDATNPVEMLFDW
jgi:Calcineurin-like phosphoesterase